jgi:hypothetical protein
MNSRKIIVSLYTLLSLVISLTGCATVAREGAESLGSTILKKGAGGVAHGVGQTTGKILATAVLADILLQNSQPQELWTEVSRDQAGWSYWNSNFGRHAKVNVYSGQVVF